MFDNVFLIVFVWNVIKECQLLMNEIFDNISKNVYNYYFVLFVCGSDYSQKYSSPE